MKSWLELRELEDDAGGNERDLIVYVISNAESKIGVIKCLSLKFTKNGEQNSECSAQRCSESFFNMENIDSEFIEHVDSQKPLCIRVEVPQAGKSQESENPGNAERNCAVGK